jgi:hypothetical protein
MFDGMISFMVLLGSLDLPVTEIITRNRLKFTAPEFSVNVFIKPPIRHYTKPD